MMLNGVLTSALYVDLDTCVFASTTRDHPIHLWDATSGQVLISTVFYVQKINYLLILSLGNPYSIKSCMLFTSLGY